MGKSVEELDLLSCGDAVHALFQAAYRDEAELLGVEPECFPPLTRTLQELCCAPTHFLGVKTLEGALMGGVEYEQTDEGIEIWSLCTSGRHRRQGVARALLQHVLNLGAEKVWVSTGMDNTPAKKLYMREGFGLKAQTRTSDGVAICLFEWNARRDSKTKVFAYVIHPCLSNVLIARHVDFPEAGLQVPAGTVEPGEALEDALWREVEEETGLSSECFEPLVRKLGEAIVEVNTSRGSQCHYRHFFRLDVRGDVECLETWQHTETFCDDGSPPVLLEYFWCPVKLARHVLWPGHGEYLDALHQDSSP